MNCCFHILCCFLPKLAAHKHHNYDSEESADEKFSDKKLELPFAKHFYLASVLAKHFYLASVQFIVNNTTYTVCCIQTTLKLYHYH